MSRNSDTYFKFQSKNFLYFLSLRTLFTKTWLPPLTKEILSKNDVEKNSTVLVALLWNSPLKYNFSFYTFCPGKKKKMNVSFLRLQKLFSLLAFFSPHCFLKSLDVKCSIQWTELSGNGFSCVTGSIVEKRQWHVSAITVMSEQHGIPEGRGQSRGSPPMGRCPCEAKLSFSSQPCQLPRITS